MVGRRLGVGAALVDGEVIPGDVVVADGVIRAVGASPAGPSGIAVPGFVDLQVNGFGGVDFLATDVEGYRQARRALARSGVTSFQPTLVSAPLDALRQALGQASKAGQEGGARILGVHLEGPFLAPKWKGAHDERHMLPPDLRVAEQLCGWGPVTYMTVAPEQPGGLELLSWLVTHGITVAVGHTDADAAMAHAAYNLGARAATHLYNAQRRFTSRDPGITGVALTRADVVVELIVDFVHLAPETVLGAYLAAGRRFALVTDAIAAAAHGPGEYRLGDRAVHVDDTAARLADGTLAGSILTMDQAVRNLISLGIPFPAAVAAATAVPAALAGRPELGTLRPGTPADVAVLDDGHLVARTLLGGREIWPG
jgi:N-acetylglucosamine-6-phosphate deacetylase